MIEALPHYEKCFFVHYQCDKFNEGESITALNIHSKGKGKEYKGNEAESIREYADKINELQNEGLRLVHWNQDRDYFGIEHINKRYKDLTGDNLELEYINDINLAKWLCEKYNDKYVQHYRLDNLAKLNGFNGVKETEDGQRTFASNRLLLITKIYCSAFSNTLKTEITELEKALPFKQDKKQKPKLNSKLIIFKNSEIIKEIHTELKGYFLNKEAELFKVLEGEQITEILLFPHNQNKFVEVFRRLKYNGFLLNNDTEIKNWICLNFQYLKRGIIEPQLFNENTVWANLNKGRGEPTKKERICIAEWLPYKTPLQLTRGKENEKL